MNNFRRANAQPDIGLTKNLVDMGFSEDQAKRALTISNNNLNAAADLILSNENLDDLMNPYQQPSQSIPSKVIINIDQNPINNRFQSFSMHINNAGPNNNTNSSQQQQQVLGSSNQSTSINNLINPINTVETNSNLSILNNLVLNNQNASSLNEESNYSYQE
jgi:uncharacterized UBP type Zn finger protein